MGLGLALGLSAGGSVLGGLLGGDGGVGAANDYNMLLNQRVNDLYRVMGQREARYFRDATKLFQARADAVLGDLDRSEAQIGQGTRSALRQANTGANQAQAAMTTALNARGLGNSSIAANAQRGVASDLARNVGDIYAREGAIKSQLGQSRAGYRAQVEGDLANLPLMRNSSMQNRLMSWADALEGMSATPSGSGSGLSSLLGNAGLLGGLALGGGAGGGAGGGFLGSLPSFASHGLLAGLG